MTNELNKAEVRVLKTLFDDENYAAACHSVSLWVNQIGLPI